jgi:AraC-like DNA-binding protein
MHPRTLRRRFRREFNTTPQVWLEARRMIEARKLLRAGMLVKQVSLALCYKQVSHFCRKFNECHGLSPQAWRRAQPE